jgi:glycine amidinotransferase
MNATASINGQEPPLSGESGDKSSANPVVNAWTQWGKLEEVCVGRALNACFPPIEPAFHAEINDPHMAALIDWPEGRKAKWINDEADKELENFVTILEGEGIKVVRPEPVDHYKKLKAPGWEVNTMYCTTCPRDVMITIGNVVMEATMSKRSRFFEYLPYRSIIRDYWRRDPNMMWKAAPKPSMDDCMYKEDFWDWSKEKRYEKMHDYEFCVTNEEPVFDAADITRCGKDIFVQESMTTNKAGIEWLSRELKGHVRVHTVHFPYDLHPSHIDCTFVPLRPGLVLTNPERPIAKGEECIFKQNDWDFRDAAMPMPQNIPMPAFCQSSKWLAMNLLSLDEKTVVIEEGEKDMKNVLEDLGMDCICIPYRRVFEFGGSIHCSTWDIRRVDSCKDFFPNQ